MRPTWWSPIIAAGGPVHFERPRGPRAASAAADDEVRTCLRREVVKCEHLPCCSALDGGCKPCPPRLFFCWPVHHTASESRGLNKTKMLAVTDKRARASDDRVTDFAIRPASQQLASCHCGCSSTSVTRARRRRLGPLQSCPSGQAPSILSMSTARGMNKGEGLHEGGSAMSGQLRRRGAKGLAKRVLGSGV